MYVRKTIMMIGLLFGLCFVACTDEPIASGTESSTPPVVEESSPETPSEEETVLYTLTATATNCEVSFENAQTSVAQGATVRFSVAFDCEVCDETTLSVTINGEPVTGEEQENGAYAFEYKEIAEDIEVCATIDKRVYKVTFSAPQGFGFWDVEKEYRHGETIDESHAPKFFETGWMCLWDIPSAEVTKSQIYYPFVAKTIATVEEFLAIERSQNYILVKDIDFVGKTLSATENGAVIPYFDSVFDGNGYALKNLTLSGTALKHVFGELHRGILRNLRVENAVFAGTETVALGAKAYSCAFVGKMTKNAEILNSRFEIVYTATGTAERPNAGLVYEIVNGSFTDCTLSLKTPNGNAPADYVYAVCVLASPETSLEGVSVDCF